MNIAVIADEDTLVGFRLAGITRVYRYEEQRVERLCGDVADAILVITTESIAPILRAHNIKPLLVEIPDKSGSRGKALERLGKLFESAIGMKLKGE